MSSQTVSHGIFCSDLIDSIFFTYMASLLASYVGSDLDTRGREGECSAQIPYRPVSGPCTWSSSPLGSLERI